MSAPAPAAAPPFAVIAPFFVAAPLGLAAAGALLAGAEEDALLAVNAPRLVAVTHALVLGWLTLSIMGALYQLGPAVLGGRVPSLRLLRTQFWVHVISVAAFVPAFAAWDIRWMSAAGVGVVVSFILFFVAAIPSVGAFRPGSLTRAYVSFALAFFALAGGVGITYAGTLEHLWFPVTLGRLAGHAHLGLLGWLGLVLMGVSYQVVPMFNVVHERHPRFGRPALWLTAAAAAGGSLWLMSDPGRDVRVLLALGMALGPALWAADMVVLLRARSRRRLDIQGRATFVSLGFLLAAILLAVLVAIGEPAAPRGEPARLHLAYGAVAVGGWAGITLIGNSYKIVPFLTWYHRYRHLAGAGPVPMVADLYDARLAHGILATHIGAIILAAGGSLAGSIVVVNIAGALLAAGGGALFLSLLAITVHRPAGQRMGPSPQGFAP